MLTLSLSVAFCAQYRQSANLFRAEKAVKTPQHCGFCGRATLVFCPTSSPKRAASVLSNHNCATVKIKQYHPTHHASDSISNKSARKITSGACLPASAFSLPLFYVHNPVCFCPHPRLFHTLYQNHPIIRQTASGLDLSWLSLSVLFCRFDSS